LKPEIISNLGGKKMEAKILKSYYMEDSYGYFQLVQDDDSHFLVGWNAIQSIDNDDWGYSVHQFTTYEEANAAYEAQYAIDKDWGNTI
jgi:hypothetical protein